MPYCIFAWLYPLYNSESWIHWIFCQLVWVKQFEETGKNLCRIFQSVVSKLLSSSCSNTNIFSVGESSVQLQDYSIVITTFLCGTVRLTVGSNPRPALARMTARAMFLSDADHLKSMLTPSFITGMFLSRKPIRSIPTAQRQCEREDYPF